MSDFDSGDDLFDGVDAETILRSSQPRVSSQSQPQHQQQSKPQATLPEAEDDDFWVEDYDDGDDLFEDTTAEAILKSSQGNAAIPSHKRKVEALGDGECDTRTRIKLEEGSPDAKRPRIKSEEWEDFKPEPMKLDLARSILTQKFGHKEFRLEQEAAIQAILHDRNAMVIFPTGGGKSLCYQIPALAFEELDRRSGSRGAGSSGISIVVSPLLALMKDQVDVLKRKGISAESLDSTKTWEEQQAVSAAMRDGTLRLLYCAPERLNNEGFIESIKRIPGGVRLVAVDEAHCISEWGHQFRPDYLKVARFVQEVKAERAICLTATATTKVAEDVCAAFDVDQADVYRTSPYRPNLTLLAKSVPKASDKFDALCEFLTKHPGPSLIYASTRDDTEKLAKELASQGGFNSKPYHAGLKTDERRATQEMFMQDKVDVVVATIAFGMGIDKPNLRTIVHYGIPGSVEEYSQQIGRAGRDGKPSTCMFFLCPEDMNIRESFARGDTPSKRSLLALLQNIFSEEVVALPVGSVFKRCQYQQSKDYDIGMNPLGVIYAALELRFGLIRAITPEYGEYKYEPTPRYNAVIANDRSREGKAIAENATMAKKYYHIDIQQATRLHGLNRQDLISKLNQLHSRGVIKLTATGIEHRYRTLTDELLPRTPQEIDDLASELLVDLEAREEEAMRRIDEVVGLVTRPVCFALSLARHFDMDLPGDKKGLCGHCSFCLDGRPATMAPRPSGGGGGAMAGLIDAILRVCHVRDDPRFLARVAFGIASPRVYQLGLNKAGGVFGSMEGHDFKALMKEFTEVCEREQWGKNSGTNSGSAQETKPKLEPSSSSQGKAKKSWKPKQQASYRQGSQDRSQGRWGSQQYGRGSHDNVGAWPKRRYPRVVP